MPPSTTTPPIAVPWPPIHLVAEWMTMSAPCLIGWASSGAKVLSTMTGTPRAWATSAIAGEVVDVEARVADQLEEDGLGLVVDRPAERRRIGAVDEGRRDADLGQRVR